MFFSWIQTINYKFELSEAEGHYTGRYVFTDLNGESKQPVEFSERKFWPVIYLAHLDAMVLQERATSLFKGEYHPVHIHQFADGSKTKVTKDAMLVEEWFILPTNRYNDHQLPCI